MEYKKVRKDLNEYYEFKWKCIKEERVGNVRVHHQEYTLERDQEIDNYEEIVSLEKEYFALKSKIQTYQPIDGLWCLVAFLFFFIPGIIYVAHKTKQKKNIAESNKNINKRMQSILDKVRKI